MLEPHSFTSRRFPIRRPQGARNEALACSPPQTRRMPYMLLYSEEYASIADAFAREKQVQGWSRRRRRALIEGRGAELPMMVRQEKDRRTRAKLEDP